MSSKGIERASAGIGGAIAAGGRAVGAVRAPLVTTRCR